MGFFFQKKKFFFGGGGKGVHNQSLKRLPLVLADLWSLNNCVVRENEKRTHHNYGLGVPSFVTLGIKELVKPPFML